MVLGVKNKRLIITIDIMYSANRRRIIRNLAEGRLKGAFVEELRNVEFQPEQLLPQNYQSDTEPP